MANNYTFYHEQKELHCIVHGDDFVNTGPDKSLRWLEETWKKEFKIKARLNNNSKILNRITRYTDNGIELEAELRHAGLIVQQFGLESAKELSCPSAHEIIKGDSFGKLNSEYTTQFKSIVARAYYLSMRRPEIQVAVKKLATSMSAPTNQIQKELKHLGRYIQVKPRPVIKCDWQEPIYTLTANSDSDGAGEKKPRKSTSGGIIGIGSHYIKS